MADTPPAQALQLTAEIKALVNGALADGAPLLVAAVSPDTKPVLSFRGSVQTQGDEQLGFWLRNHQGGTLAAITVNPHVSLLYRNGATRAMFQFHGRARIADDPGERAAVFEAAPQLEQNADPERKGIAVIVELDRVEGFFGFGPNGPVGFTRMAR
jgi:hypothetical protein